MTEFVPYALPKMNRCHTELVNANPPLPGGVALAAFVEIVDVLNVIEFVPLLIDTEMSGVPLVG
jgi:hypothetical protein